MDWQAFGLSLRLALATTLVLLVLGLPLGYWLANTRCRFKFLIETFVSLPMVLPPTVLGFYLLLFLGGQSPVGRFYEKLTGGQLPFSFGGLLVGSVFYSLPFAVQPFISGFLTVDKKFVEASWCLGVSKMGTFFRLILPLALPSILTGIILCFAHTLGEFGVVLMIGGNIPGVTRTISISIYDEVQAMNYSDAMKTSGILVAVSFSVLILTSLIRRKGLRLWN